MSSKLERITKFRDGLNARIKEIERERLADVDTMEVDSVLGVPINPDIGKKKVPTFIDLPYHKILDYLDFESRLTFQKCCRASYQLITEIPPVEANFSMQHVDLTKMIITMTDEKRDFETEYVFEKIPNTTTKNQVEFRREDRASYARTAFKFLGKLCTDKRVDVKKMTFSLENYNGPANIGVQIPRLDLLRFEKFISHHTYPSLLQCFNVLGTFEFYDFGRSWCGCRYDLDSLIKTEPIQKAKTLIISSGLPFVAGCPRNTLHENVLFRCSIYNVYSFNFIIGHFLKAGPSIINDGKQDYRFEILDLDGDREKIGEGLIVLRADPTSEEVVYTLEGSLIYVIIKFVGFGVTGRFGTFKKPYVSSE